MKIKKYIIVSFVLFVFPFGFFYAYDESYENSYRNQILNEFYNYPFVFENNQMNRLKDYINLCPNDREIQFYLVNLYELYGDYEESIRLLKKMQSQLENQSKTHEFTYYKNIGYQRYFYYKFNMSRKLQNADKIISNLKKPAIKDYFEKDSWIPIDQKLNRGECPTENEFHLFNKFLEEYKNGITKGVPLMVFLRMHFDMLFAAGCNSKANEIRDSFKTYHSIRQNKYSEALYLTMLADYKLLKERKSCSITEAYELYDKVDGYIGTEINAEWIRQEIEYRMERIRGNYELERSSGDCKS